MLDNGWEEWDHGMTDIINDRSKIEKIDADLITEMWVNTDFMEIAWEYGARISQDRRTFLPKLMEGGTNIFVLVTASDISYAVTTYVKNKKFWRWTHEHKQKEKAAEAHCASPSRREASPRHPRQRKRVVLLGGTDKTRQLVPPGHRLKLNEVLRVFLPVHRLGLDNQGRERRRKHARLETRHHPRRRRATVVTRKKRNNK